MTFQDFPAQKQNIRTFQDSGHHVKRVGGTFLENIAKKCELYMKTKKIVGGPRRVNHASQRANSNLLQEVPIYHYSFGKKMSAIMVAFAYVYLKDQNAVFKVLRLNF